jgi:hypothetical protein
MFQRVDCDRPLRYRPYPAPLPRAAFKREGAAREDRVCVVQRRDREIAETRSAARFSIARAIARELVVLASHIE